MRKMWFAAAAMAVAMGAAGCDTSTSGDKSTVAPWPSPGLAGAAGAKSDVCTQVRNAITSHMAPLGTALGQYVGYRTSTDGPDQTTAATSVRTQITSIGTAITDATSGAADDPVRTAAQSAAASLKILTDDPAFLSDINTVADLPVAMDKLTAAIQPLANACQ